MLFLVYLMAGAFSGLLSGLFGIGGGVILVPILTIVLFYSGIPHSFVVHVAISTSLATIMLTASIVSFSQWRKNNIDWKIFNKAIIPIVIGTIIATYVSHFIKDTWLSFLFAILLFITAGRFFFKSNESSKQELFPPIWQFSIISFLLALLSTFAGLGGGVLFMPYLNYCGISLLKSIGTVSVCTFLLSTTATIFHALLGEHLGNVSWTLGYIYLPAFFGIITTSILFAPLGVKLANHVSVHKLKIGFSILLFFIAIKMICDLLFFKL